MAGGMGAGVSGAAQVALLRPFGGRLARRTLAVVAVALLLAALYMFWFRDLSVFAVKEVHFEGVPAKGSDSARLRSALENAAGEMTTLHLRPELLTEAASRFPLVRSVSADAGFPNTLTIHVSERRPSALIGSGEGATAVAGDGTILRGLAAGDLDLPALPLAKAPARARLVGTGLQQALVLGAAPRALQPYVDRSFYGSGGVEVELNGGIELRFGSAWKRSQKWAAAAAVLADPGLTALDYVDLTAPRRPAVGGSGHLLPTVP
jgi:cell division protein FtsQ